MTHCFSLRTTPRFDRLLHSLQKQHHDIAASYAEALDILCNDPHNVSRRHNIKKLEGIRAGDGQYRLTLRRWRLRYDIIGREVVLHYCGLRREDTYR